jgi:hypothetical protein
VLTLLLWTVLSRGTVVQPARKMVPSVTTRAKMRIDFIAGRVSNERGNRVTKLQAFNEPWRFGSRYPPPVKLAVRVHLR